MVAVPGDDALRSTAGTEREEGAMARFEQRKTQKMEAISCGADKSKKGSFDAPIADMLDHLNMHEEYVSTSSCSGRIAIFWDSTEHEMAWTPSSNTLVPGEEMRSNGEGDSRRNKKGGLGGKWLLCQHGTVTEQDVLEALERAPKGKGLATFKHEPFILHVECRNLEAAARLMEVARNGGFRESGISIGKKHVMVAVRTSSLKIEAPVLENGRLMVSSEYIQTLVRLANEKFIKNQERTDRLYGLLKRSLLAHVKMPECVPADSVVLNQESAADQAGQGEERGQMALLCCASACEEVRSLLVTAEMLDKRFRNCKRPDGRIAIPILPCAAALLDSRAHEVASLGANAVPKGLADYAREGLVSVERVDALQPAGKGGGKISPYQRVIASLTGLLQKRQAGEGAKEQKHVSKALVEKEGGVPRKWEEYSDMVVLPERALASHIWEGVPEDLLWRTAAEALGVARLAVKAEVDAGPMRQSHVKIVHPRGADGWVKVVQNGLIYTFDVTKVMFSRGNVNERRRMGAVPAKGETAVDLYAGIGYFTVPLLAQAGVVYLYACELNPDSVEALRRNLKANGVEGRCHVLPGDNALSVEAFRGRADRVNLGLLPSSEPGWPLAIAALKTESGGWLHVHENVAEADEAAWVSRLEEEMRRLASEGGKGAWECRVRNLEHVKTFAPRVWHVVADVECRPAA